MPVPLEKAGFFKGRMLRERHERFLKKSGIERADWMFSRVLVPRLVESLPFWKNRAVTATDPASSSGSSSSGFSSKAALRTTLKERLALVEPPAATESARRVAGRVLGLPELASARSVLVCLSFGTELGTEDLIERLRSSGRQVYLPRTDPRDRSLHLHAYPCSMKTLSFGLREPLPSAPELPPDSVSTTLDAALILGLAFDRKGYRLGHGGGYFDRFLRGRPFPAIGLAYDFQLVDQVPVESHDLPMALVVTDHGIYRSGRG